MWISCRLNYLLVYIKLLWFPSRSSNTNEYQSSLMIRALLSREVLRVDICIKRDLLVLWSGWSSWSSCSLSGPRIQDGLSHMSGTLAGIISNLFIRSLLQGSWTSSCQPGPWRVNVPREAMRAANLYRPGPGSWHGVTFRSQQAQSPPEFKWRETHSTIQRVECDRGSALIFNLLY